MAPGKYNFSIYKGETWSKSLQFKRNGLIYPLTGLTLKAQIRPRQNAQELIDTFDCDVDEANGIVVLSLTAAQTAALNPGTLVWDLQATDENDKVTYFAYGDITIWGRVTV